MKPKDSCSICTTFGPVRGYVDNKPVCASCKKKAKR